MTSKLLYTISAATGTAVLAWGLKSSINKTAENSSPTFLLETHCAQHVSNNIKLENAISRARELIIRTKQEVGAPGLVVGVSIHGKTVWKEGFGVADVEKRSPCHEDTVMRIASISKSMTMAIVARLWEDGKLDLDLPIQHYVPSFPHKKVEGKEVEITTRQLVSHLAGIRHYVKKGEKDESELSGPNKKKDDKVSTRQNEVYNKDYFETVEAALKLFKDDELLSAPGTQYTYTTHGWTLVSAVVEGAGKEPFTKQARRLFVQLGLHNTRLDEPEPIIYNRASLYRINSTGKVVNVPYTDNSYKWAGGGFLSTVGDLLKFGNIMLYSYQWRHGITVEDGKVTTKYITDKAEHPVLDLPPGFLRPETVKNMWTRVPLTKGVANGLKYRDDGYGMGWQVAPYRAEYGTTGGGDVQLFHACHSGAAVGASSILFILPSENKSSEIPPPSGVCVAMLTNMQNVGLNSLADNVAQLFVDVI